MNNKSIVVNFFSGPGSGKSTIAAGLFYNLKKLDVNVELLREFAKEKVLEENYIAMDFQPYITGNQNYAQDRAVKNFDVVVTDSPILLGVFYDKEEHELIKRKYEEYLVEKFKTYNNINYFIKREYNFKYHGRRHNYQESLDIDKKIINFLDMYNIPYKKIDSSDDVLEDITKNILFELRNGNGQYDFKNANINIKWDDDRLGYIATAEFKNYTFEYFNKDDTKILEGLENEVKLGKIRIDAFKGPDPLLFALQYGSSRPNVPISEIPVPEINTESHKIGYTTGKLIKSLPFDFVKEHYKKYDPYSGELIVEDILKPKNDKLNTEHNEQLSKNMDDINVLFTPIDELKKLDFTNSLPETIDDVDFNKE